MSVRTVVTITNHEELLDFFCTARVHGDSIEMMNQRLSHRVYKDTRCGAWAKLEAPTMRKIGEVTDRWTFVYRTGNNEGSLMLGLCIHGEDWFHSSDLHKDVRDWANPPGFTREQLEKVRAGNNGVIRVFVMNELTAIEADVPVGVYEPVPAGVSFGSIIEGSDAEVTGVPLRYPFTSTEVVDALEWVEARVDEVLSEGKS